MEMQKPKRAKRDPEGRRRAIIEAAAEIIAREGTRKLTHRRVAQQAGVPLGSTTQYFSSIDELRRAALAELARLIEEDYDEMFRAVDAAGGTAQAYAHELNAYLADAEQVAIDTAFYSTAANAYHQAGLTETAQTYDRLADAEFENILASLQAAAVPDEPNPVKIDWNC